MRTKDLLKMFINEGLVGGDGIPQELPKLNPDMAQNKNPGGSNKIEVPQNKDGDNEPGTNKPDLSKDLKKDGDEEDSETKTELEATDRALAIAEYHLKKMNSMKDLKEVEDIDLDKMGAAHKIITDTRAALQEMIGKCSKKKVEKPIKESSENPEFAEFKILTTLPVKDYGDTEAAFEVAKKQKDDAIAAVKKEIKRFVPKYPSGVTFWAVFKDFDSKNLKYARAYYDVIIEGTKVFIDDLKKKYLEADDLPWYESIEEDKSTGAFVKEHDGILAFSPKKFSSFIEKYSMVIDPSDIEIRGNDIHASFSSVELDGSISPETLVKLKKDLMNIDHVDFVVINTNKFQLRIDFDEEVQEYEVLPESREEDSNEPKIITTDEFFDTYKPIKDGHIFETYGKDLAFVKSQPDNLIWTYQEEDGKEYYSSGYHVVNRLGYLIASVPFVGEIVAKDEEDNEDDLEEDSNKDLVGASVFGIGGEEKLVNINQGDNSEEIYLTDESELGKIRSARMGNKEAPFFFQKGGWYYPAHAKRPDSKIIKGIIDFDSNKRKTKKEALEMMKSFAFK